MYQQKLKQRQKEDNSRGSGAPPSGRRGTATQADKKISDMGRKSSNATSKSGARSSAGGGLKSKQSSSLHKS